MKTVIYGIGSFADYVSYVLSHDSNYKIMAFCIESNLLKSNISGFGDLPIIAFETVEILYPPNEYKMFIAVGDNEVRERIFYQAKEKGFTLLSYISSKSIFWDNLKYGENVFISEDTGIQPFVSIDDNCILMGPKIGHHSQIGKHNLLSCCFIAGNVQISNNCFLGLNSSVKQGVRIGNKNIIGMGCIITKNTNENEVYHNKTSTQKRALTSDHFRNKYLR